MTNSNAPAGWYPDTEQLGTERWWDGAQWTDHRRPGATVTPPPPAATPAAPTAPEKPIWRRTWFVVTAAVVAVVIVGSIGSTIAGGNRATEAVAQSTPAMTPTAEATPETTPTTEPAAEETEQTLTAVDPTFFKATAGKQLDDYEKDLNDLTDAVSKGSVLRVMSNSVELAFNDGQLTAIDPTANVAAEWTAALAALSTATDQISNAASKSDYTTVTTLIGQASSQIASLRDILSRAA